MISRAIPAIVKPGPPGWGLGDELRTDPRNKKIVLKIQTLRLGKWMELRGNQTGYEKGR